jgi:preprotein translocase subunit SecD
VHRYRRAFVVCVLFVAAGCSSSKHSAAPTTTRGNVGIPRSTVVAAPRGRLEFRPLRYRGDVPLQYPSAAGGQCSKLIARNPPDTDTARSVVLFDRPKKSCYVLGPVLVTGASVDSGSVLYDSTSSQWSTNIHFRNNDFIVKIAQPLTNKAVAIVLNGVVESAPVINPGITGRDVEITGNFTKTQAVDTLASILGVTPASVHVALPGD